MKLLLECGGVNPDLPDSNGRTLLSFAAEWGREDPLKLLLERGNVNPDSLDKNGQTPLSYATLIGRESIVKQQYYRELEAPIAWKTLIGCQPPSLVGLLNTRKQCIHSL